MSDLKRRVCVAHMLLSGGVPVKAVTHERMVVVSVLHLSYCAITIHQQTKRTNIHSM